MKGQFERVDLDELVTTLSGHRYRFAHEEELQQGIAQVLEAANYFFQPEFPLTRYDIVDFMVGPQLQYLGGIGIEAKVAYSLAEVTRQLHRYAQIESVGALILVTSRSRHSLLPDTLNNKPVRVIHLLDSII